jgi:hypothetical protein
MLKCLRRRFGCGYGQGGSRGGINWYFIGHYSVSFGLVLAA